MSKLILFCIESTDDNNGPKQDTVYSGRNNGSDSCYELHINSKANWYKSRFIVLSVDTFEQQIRNRIDDSSKLQSALYQAAAFFNIPLQTTDSNPDIPMNYDNKPLANATFINGKDLADFNEAECLAHIARLKSEIANYQNVGVSSKTLDLRITEREEALKVVVAKLDSLSD